MTHIPPFGRRFCRSSFGHWFIGWIMLSLLPLALRGIVRGDTKRF